MSASQAFAYGSSVETALDVEAAAARLRAAFADAGWQIVFETGVADASPAAIAGTVPYRLFGAWPLDGVREALGYEEHLGLLLPFNVVVTQRDGVTAVAAIHAREALRATNNGMLADFADRADAVLAAVLARVCEP